MAVWYQGSLLERVWVEQEYVEDVKEVLKPRYGSTKPGYGPMKLLRDVQYRCWRDLQAS